MCSGVFGVNFEHISHLFFSVFVADSEQVNVYWVNSPFQKTHIPLSCRSQVPIE